MALQLAFVIIILSKNCDGKASERVKLVKIGLKSSIIDMLYKKALNWILILAIFVSISTIFICFVKAWFENFFHKAIFLKVKFVIIL